MPKDNSTPRPAEAELNWWQQALRSGTGQAIRWLLVLILLVGHWLVTTLGPIAGHGHWLTTGSQVFGQKGNPGNFAGWVPVIIISVLLLLPDLESVAFGGVKLEMRRTREEVTDLREQITNLVTAQAQARAGAIGTLSLQTDNPDVARVFATAVEVPARIAANEGAPAEPYQPDGA
jgi:hypothetical protein